MQKTHFAVAERSMPQKRGPNPARQAALEALRRQVRALEGGGLGAGMVSLGSAGGLVAQTLARGATHEVVGDDYLDGPAAAGFALCVCARALVSHPGVLVWVSAPGSFDFGAPYGAGWARLGLDPGRVLFVRAPDLAQAQGAMEEAARTPGIAAVFGVLGARVSGTVGRRLQLAAETGGGFVTVWRPAGAQALAGVRSRWGVSGLSSAVPAWAQEAGLKGRALPPGPSAFRLTPLKGRTQERPIAAEWRNATDGFYPIAPLVDRAPTYAPQMAYG
jgi:protein ImuA